MKVSKANHLVLKRDYDFSLFDHKTTKAFKGMAIITVIVSFYSLDYEEMKLSLIKAKDNLCDYIHFCINSKTLLSKENKSKWRLLMKSTKQKNATEKKIIQTFIKSIFGLRIHYKCILNQLNQLLDNITKLTIPEIVGAINSSILFNHDHLNQKNDEETRQKVDLIPVPPFISTPNIKNYTLVLDMDETLTHNLLLPFGSYFLARPHVMPFLKEMSQYFELIIFTASAQSYADNIINQLNQDGVISHRLYRNHSSTINNKTVKELSKIGRPIEKVMLVDNIKDNAKGFYDNYIPITSWAFDLFDRELPQLATKLKSILEYDKDDLRKGNKASHH